MAELNLPTHRWYQTRFHIRLARDDYSKEYIQDSGLSKIDAHIVAIGDWVLSGGVWNNDGVWLDSQNWDDGA